MKSVARSRFEGLLSMGRSVAEAQAELELGGEAPARSTLYEWAREWHRRGGDQPEWEFLEDKTGRPSIVLLALGELHRASGGRIRSVDVREAELLVRIATAVGPSPSPFWIATLWRWVQLYKRASALEQRELDLALALEVAGVGQVDVGDVDDR